jgi:hypothetical protein
MELEFRVDELERQLGREPDEVGAIMAAMGMSSMPAICIDALQLQFS